jgi:hypothetical protein
MIDAIERGVGNDCFDLGVAILGRSSDAIRRHWDYPSFHLQPNLDVILI